MEGRKLGPEGRKGRMVGPRMDVLDGKDKEGLGWLL